MRKQKLNFIIAIFMVLVSFACSNRNNNVMMSNITGKAGETVIVINKEVWEGEAGDLIYKILAQDMICLPQSEPILNVINIPHAAFGDIFKTSRNIVMTNISSTVTEPGVSYQKDVHSFMQAYVTIKAKNTSEFIDIVKTNGEKIAGFFIKAERDRLLYNYAKYRENTIIKETKEMFGITLNVPPGFKIREKEENFIWMMYDTPEISQGIVISSYPYNSEEVFTKESAIAQRNIIGKKYLPGPTEGSYMGTETIVPLVYQTIEQNGNYASELRGLWKVENDFMGGPFVSLSVLDVLNQRVVVLDAYVYAPRKKKRDYLRQLEGMIYSMKFINQEEIDKVLKQYEL